MSKHVPADLAACAALRRRGTLGWLMEQGAHVTVMNPDGGAWPGGVWTGRIIGLADHPTMLLETAAGRRWSLPQAFEVREVDQPVAPPLWAGDLGVDLAAMIERAVTEGMRHHGEDPGDGALRLQRVREVLDFARRAVADQAGGRDGA